MIRLEANTTHFKAQLERAARAVGAFALDQKGNPMAVDALLGAGPFASALATALGLDPERTLGYTLRVYPREPITVTAEIAVKESEAGAATEFLGSQRFCTVETKTFELRQEAADKVSEFFLIDEPVISDGDGRVGGQES